MSLPRFIVLSIIYRSSFVIFFASGKFSNPLYARCQYLDLYKAIMFPEQLMRRFSANPKHLFLLDGLGALVSAFLLGVVLVQFEGVFGIPRSTLYFLAIIPCFFAVFDIVSFRSSSSKHALCLRIIASLNIAYCIVSIGWAAFAGQTITILGWAYLLIEVAIVLMLALFELRVVKKIAG